MRINSLRIDLAGSELETLKGCEGILDQVEHISIDLGLKKVHVRININSLP